MINKTKLAKAIRLSIDLNKVMAELMASRGLKGWQELSIRDGVNHVVKLKTVLESLETEAGK